MGKQLLQRIETCALEHDCAYLRLEVRTDNPAAIALYERNGYRRFALIHDYYEDQPTRCASRNAIRSSRLTRIKVPAERTNRFNLCPACLLMAWGTAAEACWRPWELQICARRHVFMK